LEEIKSHFNKWKEFSDPYLAKPGLSLGSHEKQVLYFNRNEDETKNIEDASESFIQSERSIRTERAEQTKVFTTLLFVTLGFLTAILAVLFTTIGRKTLQRVSRSYGIALESEKKAQEDLRRALVSRDEFFSIASHELKTPLTSLKLKNQLAKRGIGIWSQGENSNKYLIESGEQIERLVRLVDDMLDLSRYRAGTLLMQMEEFDAAELVRTIMERLSPQLDAQGMKLSLEANSPCYLTGDRMRIEQVLQNLVVNAIKYAPGNPLEVRLHSNKNHVEILVQDSGPGIAENDQERIFQRFERATSSNHVTGLGIGLYLARAIVEAHRGTLEVKSELGKGATFIIELPRSPSPRSTEQAIFLGPPQV
jgi:signal transduction histidine kinase